ncbi:hypothetical protein JCM8547_002682 [Rhodosporidiobolus lusitaniae]
MPDSASASATSAGWSRWFGRGAGASGEHNAEGTSGGAQQSKDKGRAQQHERKSSLNGSATPFAMRTKVGGGTGGGDQGTTSGTRIAVPSVSNVNPPPFAQMPVHPLVPNALASAVEMGSYNPASDPTPRHSPVSTFATDWLETGIQAPLPTDFVTQQARKCLAHAASAGATFIPSSVSSSPQLNPSAPSFATAPFVPWTNAAAPPQFNSGLDAASTTGSSNGLYWSGTPFSPSSCNPYASSAFSPEANQDVSPIESLPAFYSPPVAAKKAVLSRPGTDTASLAAEGTSRRGDQLTGEEKKRLREAATSQRMSKAVEIKKAPSPVSSSSLTESLVPSGSFTFSLTPTAEEFRPPATSASSASRTPRRSTSSDSLASSSGFFTPPLGSRSPSVSDEEEQRLREELEEDEVEELSRAEEGKSVVALEVVEEGEGEGKKEGNEDEWTDEDESSREEKKGGELASTFPEGRKSSSLPLTPPTSPSDSRASAMSPLSEEKKEELIQLIGEGGTARSTTPRTATGSSWREVFSPPLPAVNTHVEDEVVPEQQENHEEEIEPPAKRVRKAKSKRKTSKSSDGEGKATQPSLFKDFLHSDFQRSPSPTRLSTGSTLSSLSTLNTSAYNNALHLAAPGPFASSSSTVYGPLPPPSSSFPSFSPFGPPVLPPAPRPALPTLQSFRPTAAPFFPNPPPSYPPSLTASAPPGSIVSFPGPTGNALPPPPFALAQARDAAQVDLLLDSLNKAMSDNGVVRYKIEKFAKRHEGEAGRIRELEEQLRRVSPSSGGGGGGPPPPPREKERGGDLRVEREAAPERAGKAERAL